MPESEPQSLLFDSLPPEKDEMLEEDEVLQADLKRQLPPHRRGKIIKKFRKAGDVQGEILVSEMLGYAGTSAAEVLPAEDPLEAINGPVGALTPFDQERLLADQARLDKEFEASRPKPRKIVRTVKEIVTQLRLPDIFSKPVPEKVTQYRLFSDLEFHNLKTLTRQAVTESISSSLTRRIVVDRRLGK